MDHYFFEVEGVVNFQGHQFFFSSPLGDMSFFGGGQKLEQEFFNVKKKKNDGRKYLLDFFLMALLSRFEF